MASNKRAKAEQKGRRAEGLAAWTLRLKGYKILAQRYRSPVGEVDLIAKRGKVLVMIEVKARKVRDTGKLAISKTQRRRITQAASLFARKINHLGPIRFDVILKGDDHFFVKHIPAAWREGE